MDCAFGVIPKNIFLTKVMLMVMVGTLCKFRRDRAGALDWRGPAERQGQPVVQQTFVRGWCGPHRLRHADMARTSPGFKEGHRPRTWVLTLNWGWGP